MRRHERHELLLDLAAAVKVHKEEALLLLCLIKGVLHERAAVANRVRTGALRIVQMTERRVAERAEDAGPDVRRATNCERPLRVRARAAR